MSKKAPTNTAGDPSLTFGLDPRDTTTAEESIPVPYLAGEGLLTMQWIMEPDSQFTRPTPQGSGKKSGGGGKKGGGGAGQSNDYYANIAGLLCCGPLDYVYGFLVDDLLAWPDAQQYDTTRTYHGGEMVIYLSRTWTAGGTIAPATPPPGGAWSIFKLAQSSNPQAVTLTGNTQAQLAGCQGWVYWGTSSQTTGGDNVLNTLDHPPYRNQALVVYPQLFFGTERQEAPNISILCGRTPSQSIITGSAADLDADGTTNLPPDQLAGTHRVKSVTEYVMPGTKTVALKNQAFIASVM